MPSSPLKSSTGFMVFVLFFALCFAPFGPSSLSTSLLPVSSSRALIPNDAADLAVVSQSSSDYNTPSVKARTLKSYEDYLDLASADLPSVYNNPLLSWFSGFCRRQPDASDGLVQASECHNNLCKMLPAEDISTTDEVKVRAIPDKVNGGVETDAVEMELQLVGTENLLDENMTWTVEENIGNGLQLELNVTYTADVISVPV